MKSFVRGLPFVVGTVILMSPLVPAPFPVDDDFFLVYLWVNIVLGVIVLGVARRVRQQRGRRSDSASADLS